MVRPVIPNQRKSLSVGPVGISVVFFVGIFLGRWHTNPGGSSDGISSSFTDLLPAQSSACSNGRSFDNGWHAVEVFYGNQAHLKEMLPTDLEWFSQAFQDQAVAALLGNKQNGYFVDLAANDATVLSNTYSLEQRLRWTGLCIEPNPQYWANLTYRDCQVVAAIVGDNRMDEVYFRFDAGDHSGIAGEGFDNGPKFKRQSQKRYTVPLQEILERFNAPKKIDYLSLDVEGAEELIMKNFPLNNYHISILTVERPKDSLRALLEKNDFKFLKRMSSWGETLWAHESVMDQLDLKSLHRFGPPPRNKTKASKNV